MSLRTRLGRSSVPLVRLNGGQVGVFRSAGECCARQRHVLTRWLVVEDCSPATLGALWIQGHTPPMNRLLCLSFATLPLLASSCSTTPADNAEPRASSVDDTRAWLRDFGARYKYDVGYMEALLDLSPAAYEAFAAGMGMAEIRAHLPLDAHYVGVISALLADDCGQCTQLNLRIAVEAGVGRAILKQLLEEPERLPPTLRLVHDYATQVVKGRNAEAETVAKLREDLGDKAFAELAVNVLGARIYPALRRALGAETSCPPPSLDF